MKLIYFVFVSIIYTSIISCSPEYCYNSVNIAIPLKEVEDNKGNVIYKTTVDFPLLNKLPENHPSKKQLIDNLLIINNYWIRNRNKDIDIILEKSDNIKAYIKLSSYCGDNDPKYNYFSLSKKPFYISNEYGINKDYLLNIAPFLSEKQKNSLKQIIPEWKK